MRSRPLLFWHTLPLHYTPWLLQTGSVVASAHFAAQNLPLMPRVTAAARDRKLDLSRFVHLSFAPDTPLLRDKLRRGFPHVLVSFRADVADLSGAALLRWNPKSWRHRDDFLPVTTAEEKAQFWQEWEQGAYPSAELLIADALPLVPCAIALHARTAAEHDWLTGMVRKHKLPCEMPIVCDPKLFPPTDAPFDLAPFANYAALCGNEDQLCPPPPLPFD